jgi:predicted site-specific integrase-resolvase
MAERHATQTSPPPSRASRTAKPSALLRLAEVCAELQVPERTFREWRVKGRAPRCIRLPNGQLRISRDELDRWLDEREDTA